MICVACCPETWSVGESIVRFGRAANKEQHHIICPDPKGPTALTVATHLAGFGISLALQSVCTPSHARWAVQKAFLPLVLLAIRLPLLRR